MPVFNVFAIIGVVLVLILLGVLFLIPSDKKKLQSKKSQRPKAEEEHKDWQAVSIKLEKHIHTLRHEIDEGERQRRTLEHELTIQKEKYVKLQEKLSQERGWQEKEHQDVDKKNKEILRIKEELKKLEENIEKEHRQRLEYERQFKDIKFEFVNLDEVKRSLEKELIILQGQAEGARKEIVELRASNQKFFQKQDDAAWVAKTDYVKLEKRLEDALKEVERLRKSFPKT